MILQVEAGTERFAQWAKRKARAVDAMRKSLRLFALSKFYAPESGVLVWIKATEGGILVRVTGGAETGRKRLVTVSSTNVERFYLLKKGKLQNYSEVPYDASLSSVMSFDGSTAAGTVPNATLNAMRKNKLNAAVALETSYGTLPTVPTRLVLNQMPALPEWRLLGGSGEDVAVSQKGTLVVARETASALPRVLQCSSDNTNTILSVLSSGYPQWVLDFYAARSIPHSLYRDTTTHESYTVGLTYVLADIAALDTQNLYKRITAPTIALTSLIEDELTVRFYVAHDKFSDRPVMLVQMPYVSVFTCDGTVSPAAYTARFGVRTELRAYDSTLGWQAIYAEQFDDVATLSWTSSASFRTFLYDGVNSAVICEKSIGKTFSAGVDRPSQPYFPSIAVAKDKLGVLASYGTSNPFSVKFNGTTLFTHSSATQTVTRYGSQGTLIPSSWFGPWGVVTPTAIGGDDWLSPDGLEHLRGASGGATGWAYWKDGALKQSITGPIPAANATTYATYGTTPASGFYFLNSVVSWRYDKKQFKCLASTRINFTPGFTGEQFVHVWGGIVHVPPPIGDLLANGSGSGIGFDASGTHLYSSNSDGTYTLYTPAEVDALFGTSGTTFELDGTQYELDLGSGTQPDTYTWVTATVDVGWDAKLGSLAVKKTYSEVLQPVKSRGPLTETIPATTTVSFSDASLVQDYLLPHKV